MTRKDRVMLEDARLAAEVEMLRQLRNTLSHAADYLQAAKERELWELQRMQSFRVGRIEDHATGTVVEEGK